MKQYTVKVYGDCTVWFNSDGEKHRDDSPAVERINGTKEWYQNGELHRDGGPAKEWSNGSKEYYKHGKLHRADGPACDHASGNKHYYLNGKKYSEEIYAQIINSCNVDEVHNTRSCMCKYTYYS